MSTRVDADQRQLTPHTERPRSGSDSGSRWQAMNAISGLLAAVCIPVVLALVGQYYTSALKEREIQGHFVELALSILKEPPRPEARAVRLWALKVVDKYSGVPLSDSARSELADSVSLPAPASTASRVYLLSGSRAKQTTLDSIRTALSRAGFQVVGENPALIDEGRPAGPEVRYFNDADEAEAQVIAERLRTWLRAPTLIAQYYHDRKARPGYIEIWLGR
jgi:hypothetical protein